MLGGVPAYLRAFLGDSDLFNGIADRILTRGSFLYDEPRFLLMEGLREPAYCFSLLRAMAGGKTRPNELAQSSALADRGAVSRYLDTPHRVEGWWGRQAEIDVIALDDERQHLAVGECTWSARPAGLNVLRDLQAKTTQLLAETRGRWRRPPQVRYLLFSRAGFTEELRERAARESIQLVDAEALADV